MRVSFADVQRNVANIANRETYEKDVLFELLAAYGRSKSAITQLREGHLNKSNEPNAVLQKDVVYFKTLPAGAQLEQEVEELYEDPLTQRYNPRYLIATDLTNLAAKDTVKDTTLTIKLADIDDHVDFFYGWTGDEVVDDKTEAVADRRAADKMNELYIEIEKQNKQEFINNPNFRHELNVFFTRLLFCFFAEDTGIYADKQFTGAIKQFTQMDGSDLSWFFSELFAALDTKDEDKHALKAVFKDFPYVNGSIFNTSKHAIAIPKFSAQARHLILEIGRQNWSEINPDIFGVMFQGTIDPQIRDENGMDYTSVPNIMKVIKPLFLDELHEAFDKSYDNENKLWKLLGRIQKIKVFDPACGSGNFLIIAYKELRQLQHAIIARIDELKPGGLMSGLPDNNLININNFYGIEIDDFAHELAVLSMFLAKHQMNQEFTSRFGKELSIIPLIDLPTIVHGNAARLDWQTVCPNVGHTATKAEQEALFDFGEPEQAELDVNEKVYDEIYLIGNPPYKGSRNQTKDQKADLALLTDKYKSLDYIAAWFIKGSAYIEGTKAELAFVSTNSITQGEQVSILWRPLLKDVEIGFAHTSFKWSNSARDNAGVTCVIINLRSTSKMTKFIITDGIKSSVQKINPYLTEGDNIWISRRSKPLSSVPSASFGSMPNDGGNLLLDAEERQILLDSHPESEKWIQPFVGGAELIRGVQRFCLVVPDGDIEVARRIPAIATRLDGVREHRLKSTEKSTVKMADYPNRFYFWAHQDGASLVIPSTTSERRTYIPVAYLDNGAVASNSTQVIYGASLWLFSLLVSSVHMSWIRSVAGQLETRIRYSSAIVYNNFPIKALTESEKDTLNQSARRILLARAAHPEKTLADMYDPDKMPADLREAHAENDHLVDQLYKKGGFANDEDRLAALFDLYEKMTAKEKK